MCRSTARGHAVHAHRGACVLGGGEARGRLWRRGERGELELGGSLGPGFMGVPLERGSFKGGPLRVALKRQKYALKYKSTTRRVPCVLG